MTTRTKLQNPTHFCVLIFTIDPFVEQVAGASQFLEIVVGQKAKPGEDVELDSVDDGAGFAEQTRRLFVLHHHWVIVLKPLAQNLS